ncbi:hypothetical protein DV738_g344, partial [Chaetothyriales sp. CBS 135597]
MNWTGGQLQRHSKAKNNTQLKTQKGFLARAQRRQRAQISDALPVPSVFSHFNNHRAGGQPRAPPQPPHSAQDRQLLTPHRGHSTAEDIHPPGSVIIISSSPASDNSTARSNIATCPRDTVRTNDKKEPVVDSLDSVKRRLLVIPDWAGLNPTKPVQMNFPPAEEIERFGRRRRDDVAERQKKQHLTRSRITYHHNRHSIHRPNNTTAPDPLQPDNFSIRIGSDIHKTQTSLESVAQRTGLSGAPSQSSESMLLDKFDPKAQKNGLAKTESRQLARFAYRGHDFEPDQSLLPLNEVRDLKSWDEVLERSSSKSLVVAKAPSSTPFIERTDAAASLTPHSSCMPPPLHVPGADPEAILRSGKNKISTVKANHREWPVPTNGEIGNIELCEAPVGAALCRPPVFTLEKQVAMEQEFLRKFQHPTPVSKRFPLDPGADGLAHSGSRAHHSHLLRADLASPESTVDGTIYHDISQQLARRDKCNGISNQMADENDAWMKTVFPKDFERIQNSFSFRKPLRTWKSHQSDRVSETFGPLRGKSTVNEPLTPNPYRTVASQDIRSPNADSTIFDRTWQSRRNSLKATLGDGTSFLPLFNPMTGSYSNAPESISVKRDRIFEQQNDDVSSLGTYSRHSPLKRTAEQAFADDSPQFLRRLPFQPAHSSPSMAQSTGGFISAAQRFANNHSADLLQQKPAQPFISVPSPIDIQSAELLEKTDFAIIGSGVTGCSIAKTLLDEEESSSFPSSSSSSTITVFEARALTSGATGRNGGSLTSFARAAYPALSQQFGHEEAVKIARFANRTLAKMHELGNSSQEALDASEVRKLRNVLCYLDEESFERGKEAVKLYEQHVTEDAGSSEVLSAEEALRGGLTQRFNVKTPVGAILVPNGAFWPYRLITLIWSQLYNQFKPRLAIETHTPVTAITYDAETSRSHPYILTTPRGAVRAAKVIHATNAYTGHLLPKLRGKIFPLRGTMSTQKAPAEFGRFGSERGWSFVHIPRFDEQTGAFEFGLYYSNQNPKTGDIFIGGEKVLSDELFVSDDTQLSAISRDNLSTVLPKFFDQGWKTEEGETPEVRQIWSGIMGFTPDHLPLWIAAGFNGYGMPQCWSSGEAVAKMLLGIEVSSFLPEAYKVTEERLADERRMSPETAVKELLGIQ